MQPLSLSSFACPQRGSMSKRCFLPIQCLREPARKLATRHFEHRLSPTKSRASHDSGRTSSTIASALGGVFRVIPSHILTARKKKELRRPPQILHVASSARVWCS